MSLKVNKDGELVAKWSSTEGSIAFIERNEQAKKVSLYNIQPKETGLSDE